jgi:hypothetical protein
LRRAASRNVIRGNREGWIGPHEAHQEAVTAWVTADSAEEAEERVRAAIGDEPYAVDPAETEASGG